MRADLHYVSIGFLSENQLHALFPPLFCIWTRISALYNIILSNIIAIPRWCNNPVTFSFFSLYMYMRESAKWIYVFSQYHRDPAMIQQYTVFSFFFFFIIAVLRWCNFSVLFIYTRRSRFHSLFKFSFKFLVRFFDLLFTVAIKYSLTHIVLYYLFIFTVKSYLILPPCSTQSTQGFLLNINRIRVYKPMGSLY